MFHTEFADSYACASGRSRSWAMPSMAIQFSPPNLIEVMNLFRFIFPTGLQNGSGTYVIVSRYYEIFTFQISIPRP